MNPEAALEDRPFQELADSAPVMLWRINSSFDCDWANKAWFDFTGGTLAEQRGFAWVDLVHPDDSDRIVEAFGRAFEARAPVSVELRIRGRDGRYRWFLDSGAPYFHDGAFGGFVGSCIDITGRKEAEERTRLLCAHMIRLSSAEALGSTVSVILGELGEPLRERADLASVLRFVEPLVRAHPQAPGVAIEWRLAGGIEVEISRLEMELLITSLASNAFAAMWGMASRELRITAAAWGELAIVAISDSGPGATPDLQRLLSESLSSAADGGKGTGLYLCRSIVAALGGRIWAEQGARGGAVLKFTLPLAP